MNGIAKRTLAVAAMLAMASAGYADPATEGAASDAAASGVTEIAAVSKTDDSRPKPARSRSDQARRGERPLPDAIFNRMDADGDGKISRDEMKGPGAKAFDRIDANRDGSLDKSELTAAREKMEAAREGRRPSDARKGPTPERSSAAKPDSKKPEARKSDAKKSDRRKPDPKKAKNSDRGPSGEMRDHDDRPGHHGRRPDHHADHRPDHRGPGGREAGRPSPDQMREHAARAFRILDADGDGAINLDEFTSPESRRAMARMAPPRPQHGGDHDRGWHGRDGHGRGEMRDGDRGPRGPHGPEGRKGRGPRDQDGRGPKPGRPDADEPASDPEMEL